MWIRLLPLLLASFSLFHLRSQIDSGFVEHLSKYQLTTELQGYLSAQQPSDTLAVYWSNYHIRFGNSALFQSSVSQTKPYILSNTTALLQFSVYALQPKQGIATFWFEQFLDSTACSTPAVQTLRNTYFLAQAPIEHAEVPVQLQHDYHALYRASRKKAFVAGSLSAAVPGLGLLYLNKPRSAFTNFTFLSFLGLQLAESIQKFGWKHPITIINTGFAGGFYLVNVFGSALAVKKHVKEQKMQFLTHAATYYSDTYRVHFQ